VLLRRECHEVLRFHLQATMTCAQPTELSRVSLVLGARRAPRSEPLAIEAKGGMGVYATRHVFMPHGTWRMEVGSIMLCHEGGMSVKSAGGIGWQRARGGQAD
jgi:hypothetical protein